MDDEETQLKIIVVGSSGVGKSKLLIRYVKGVFTDDVKPTIAGDFYSKTLEVSGRRVRAQFWDTAGQELFSSISYSLYKNAHGVIMCFDLTRKETFDRLESWMKEVENHCPAGTSILITGLKSDLQGQRQVTVDEGKSFARKWKVFYIETSALSNSNVDKAFRVIMEESLKEAKKEDKSFHSKHYSLLSPSVKDRQVENGAEVAEKKGCCS